MVELWSFQRINQCLTPLLRVAVRMGLFSLVVWMWSASLALAKDRTLGATLISLDKDEVWRFDDLVLDGSTIKTNGHGLEIVVAGDLEIRGTARIYSHDPSAASPVPSPASSGAPGASFDPGPNSDGSAPGEPGRPGGAGAAGADGTAGTGARNSKPIIVRVRGSAQGKLSIDNSGMTGGAGGIGGNGGKGGDGEQGGRAFSSRRKILGLAIPAGCARGPGRGGDGGVGGDGGHGGPAGAGGNAGDIRVDIAGSVKRLTLTKGFQQQFFVQAKADSGRAGAPGLAGSPGMGGTPGYGGRGAPGCEGRVADRRGTPGVRGRAGRAGSTASDGLGGEIEISPKLLRVPRLDAVPE